MTSQTVTTSGDGVFTVPTGVGSVTAEAWGAGGGGAGSGSATAPGGGGGGYSLAVLTVIPGQRIFFHVGAHGAGAINGGNNGEDSWVNPSANSEPASNGVVGGGGGGGSASGTTGAPGVGSVGTTNFNGGTGAHGAGGGGGGAGSGGAGSDGTISGAGGAGGTPDGGAGGDGAPVAGTGGTGIAPGGGGGGANAAAGGNGADGRVRFTWTPPFGPNVETTLTGKPAKAFTRKHYYNELEKIRSEKQSERDELDGLDEKGRADRDYESAKAESDEYENNLGVRNYAKAMDAKDKLAKARKARDHHYFMDVVKKAWDDHNKK